MADAWVVMAHYGSGLVVGVASTKALADAMVGANPSMNYTISRHVIDALSDVSMPQAGAVTNLGNAVMLTPSTQSVSGRRK
jgi:hypothetical protein